MFSNDYSDAFKKMHEFSTADGFVEIIESLADISKYVANEPSAGLFYVQQHTKNAGSNLIDLKNDIVEKSNDIILHKEDLEDSISMIRSMRDSGFPAANEMTQEIIKSLSIMSTKKPSREQVNGHSSGLHVGRTRYWSPTSWGRDAAYSQRDSGRAGGYLSNIIKSAKNRASIFKWTQIESEQSSEQTGGNPVCHINSELSQIDATSSSTMQESDEDFPLSSEVVNGSREELQLDNTLSA